MFAMSTCFGIAIVVVLVAGWGKRYYISDAFWFLGWLCIAAFTIIAQVQYQKGVFEWEHIYQLPSEETQRLAWISAHLYDQGIFFPEASVVAFYFRVIPRTYPWIRIGLIVLSVYLVCGITISFCLGTFLCPHPTKTWRECPAIMGTTMLTVNFVLDFTSDIPLLIFPIPLLRDLHLRGWRRVAVYITFCVGILMILICIIRYGLLRGTFSMTLVHVCTTCEFNVCLIAASLPKLAVCLSRFRKASFLNADTAAQEEGIIRRFDTDVETCERRLTSDLESRGIGNGA
ncbi:hypothetical protein F5884DRAFT_803525 [Xylogone sp. PMI_703]|nr:hypothetical protein F5884DRAFT_803525 [Xylogone sp. PMI_703]